MVNMVRKPLVILTPKSLLRHKEAVSHLDDLATGNFRPLIGDPAAEPKKVRRIVACSGRVYYDLINRRRENLSEETAIIRIEQLYPFPAEELALEFARYPALKEIVWCQDEPKNQGYWRFIQRFFMRAMVPGQVFGYAGRAASASTACGYLEMHVRQQKALLDEAFGEFSVFFNK
jgi:2-oxoglutarate dehydrogenase E1 component